MAQRSSGIFPREGFNLDDSLKATGASTDLSGVNDLTKCFTLRVIAYGLDADSVVTVGGIEAVPAGSNASVPYVAHIRGALLADSTVAIAGASPANVTVYFEKVEG